MIRDKHSYFGAIAALLVLAAGAASGEGDATRGAAAFQACAACHSMEPGRHLTGPSLANLFGRKAGTSGKFLRYSDALKRSGVTWNEQTLDAWLKDPAKFIPGNDMAFPGIRDDDARRDLIAFLKTPEVAARARRMVQSLSAWACAATVQQSCSAPRPSSAPSSSSGVIDAAPLDSGVSSRV